jgi:hypothetical protein
MTKKIDHVNSLDNLWNERITSPKTHFFYESLGERSIEPLTLIESGVTLWHEQMHSNEEHDISHLWALASAMLEKPLVQYKQSYVEWLRHQIITGAIVPEKWSGAGPYPYKGMLISAIYFQEARRLCEVENDSRVWHIIAMAYYQLGINTPPTTTQLASKAAATRHALRSELLRAHVLSALSQIKEHGAAGSIESAKNDVVSYFMRNHKFMVVLSEFDASTPENTKHDKTSDALTRFRNMLDSWASPKSPYPELAKVFAQFSKRKSTSSIASTPKTRTTPAEVPVDDSNFYLRIIDIREDGFEQITKVVRDKAV